jgi:hypothetical protein
MAKKFTIIGVAAAVLLAAGSVRAGTLGAGLRIGTLGGGGDLTVNLGSKLNFRAGAGFFSYDDTVELDEATVDGELNLQTIPLLLDWHPAASGFRVSGGVVLNENEVDMSATPGDELNLQDRDFVVQGLDGRLTFDDVAPYLGIGYGDAVGDGGRVRFSCDFGLMYHGEPAVSATAVAQDPAVQDELNQALQAEVEEFEEDISGFVIYPVVNVGLSFAF